MTIYEDEIDLRPFIQALLQRWWLIGLSGFILAAGVFLFTYLQPRGYAANAIVLLSRDQLQLALAEQVRTISNQDARSKLDSFLTIARSDGIAQSTRLNLTEAGIQFESLANLQEIVEISGSGDTIVVKANAGNPVQAAEIANTWAQVTVETINTAFNEDRPLVEIQTQILESEKDYLEAQAALGTFIETSQIAFLQEHIFEVNTLLGSASEDIAWQITYQFQRKRQLEQLADQTRLLQQQLANGTQSTAGDLGDALAVLNSRALFFMIPQHDSSSDLVQQENMPGLTNFHVSLAPETAFNQSAVNLQIADPQILLSPQRNYSADVGTLLQLIETELAHSETAIFDLISRDEQPAAVAGLESITQELQWLQAQLEGEQARKQQLISNRDLAWLVYQALLEKEIEILTMANTNQQLSLVSPAIPSETAQPRQTITKTVIGGAAGILLAVIGIIASIWWQSLNMDEFKKPLASKPE